MAVAAGALLTVAAVVGLAVLMTGDDLPPTAAIRLVRACCADKRMAEDRFLVDDALQRTEFQRWWTRYFPSIQDRFRPIRDRLDISATTIRQSPETWMVQVTIRSDFAGQREMLQCWYKTGDKWKFDAQRTLLVIDNRRKSLPTTK